MEKSVITPEVMKDIEGGLKKGENWIVYNSIPFFLERGDVDCFKTEYEAREFVSQNISDCDLMNVFYARSLGEAIKEITGVEKGKDVEETPTYSIGEKRGKEDDCCRQKRETPTVEANHSKAKKQPENSLLPKKGSSSKRKLRTL